MDKIVGETQTREQGEVLGEKDRERLEHFLYKIYEPTIDTKQTEESQRYKDTILFEDGLGTSPILVNALESKSFSVPFLAKFKEGVDEPGFSFILKPTRKDKETRSIVCLLAFDSAKKFEEIIGSQVSSPSSLGAVHGFTDQIIDKVAS